MEGEEEDIVTLLNDEEATEFRNFDPTVPDVSTWDAWEAINKYLEWNFTREMPDKERKRFYRTSQSPPARCWLPQTRRWDEDPDNQDPHFGVERPLYTIQQQILEMAGPLTCLWADMLDQNAKVDHQTVILLVQKVLSFNHPGEEEGGLLQEEKEKDASLFGGGFLESNWKDGRWESHSQGDWS